MLFLVVHCVDPKKIFLVKAADSFFVAHREQLVSFLPGVLVVRLIALEALFSLGLP